MKTELEEVRDVMLSFPIPILVSNQFLPFQLVEFLHHGNTQIRQIGKVNPRSRLN